MIQKLEIFNFQSHQHSTLDFHPGVNAIVGVSDSGKSAVIRALRLLIYNEPSGDSYRSWWGGDTKVNLSTDGKTISRVKSDKRNGYDMDGGVTAKELLYNAIGKDVPKEVVDLLNMNTINLQQQHESFYLLNETSGEVAKHFNKVAHLEVIDETTKKVNSKITELSTSLKGEKVTLERNEEKIKDYLHLDKLEVKIEVLEEREKELIKKINVQKNMLGLIESIEDVDRKIEEFDFLIGFEGKVQAIEAKITHRNGLLINYNKLIGVTSQITKIEAEIEGLSYPPGLADLVDNTIKLIQKKDKIQITFDTLSTIVERVKKTEKEQLEIAERITRLENKFKEQMPAICPLCDTPLTENHATH